MIVDVDKPSVVCGRRLHEWDQVATQPGNLVKDLGSATWGCIQGYITAVHDFFGEKAAREVYADLRCCSPDKISMVFIGEV